jgi:PAS domain S-box-containing protein
MVMPIIHSERVLGVLEMASFQQFTDRERAVLEALIPVLATSMEIMDRNLRTKELLAATQEQAERMEKQAAQLEEQSVEMEAQQAELLETESWFRSIIESAPDGLLVVDADGRILLSNPKAEKIFGYEFGELVGTAVGQLVPPATRVSHAEMRALFMEEGQSRPMGENIKVAGLRKDGTEFPLTISLSPLPARGSRGKCVSASVRVV